MYAPGAAGGFSDNARRVVLNNIKLRSQLNHNIALYARARIGVARDDRHTHGRPPRVSERQKTV